ncbi:MAG: flagellar biosynthetic protein FliO [Gammaproteobacteria bacterium]|nr:flagellar biosynthetic protein FliO [Gammaproteobacteria bacterium]
MFYTRFLFTAIKLSRKGCQILAMSFLFVYSVGFADDITADITAKVAPQINTSASQLSSNASYFSSDSPGRDNPGSDNANSNDPRQASLNHNNTPFSDRLKKAKVEKGVSSARYFEMLVALLLIVSLIGALAWGLRRLNLPIMASTNKMKVESSLSLGHKEKLLIVNVENQRLLLGSTGGQITLIDRLSASSEIKDDNNVFSGKLRSVMQKGGG